MAKYYIHDYLLTHIDKITFINVDTYKRKYLPELFRYLKYQKEVPVKLDILKKRYNYIQKNNYFSFKYLREFLSNTEINRYYFSLFTYNTLGKDIGSIYYSYNDIDGIYYNQGYSHYELRNCDKFIGIFYYKFSHKYTYLNLNSINDEINRIHNIENSNLIYNNGIIDIQTVTINDNFYRNFYKDDDGFYFKVGNNYTLV